jgi:uncharacterized membrane protein
MTVPVVNLPIFANDGSSFGHPSSAGSISSDGSYIAGTAYLNSGLLRGYIITNLTDNPVSIGPLPGDIQSYLTGVADNGSAVGASINASAQQRGFVFSIAHGLQVLPATTGVGAPFAIAKDGKSAAGYNGLTGNAGIWIIDGNLNPALIVPDLPTISNSRARAVSNSVAGFFTAVGYGDTVSATVPLIWRNVSAGPLSTPGLLATLPGYSSGAANAISANGLYAVGYLTNDISGSSAPAFWNLTTGSVVIISLLAGGLYGYATGISSDGMNITGINAFSAFGNINHGFFYNSNIGTLDLGSVLKGDSFNGGPNSAMAITVSNNNYIVGANPTGQPVLFGPIQLTQPAQKADLSLSGAISLYWSTPNLAKGGIFTKV